MSIKFKTEDWRLFIDASKMSLKDFLLHIGNELAFIPIGQAANSKDTYETMKYILGKIQFNEYEWKISEHLKMISLLL